MLQMGRYRLRMSAVSTNYRELRPEEVDRVAAECAKAWQDPAIPLRQYELAAKGELEKYRNGGSVAPFDALIKCMRKIPLKYTGSRSKLLDVGASGGYYRQVLRHAGYFMQYWGCDFSPAFKELAVKLYPGIQFDVADARELPYHDDSIEIILHGAVLMHLRDYGKAIKEAARVSSRYVIFHRTPVSNKSTIYFEKEAYSIRCLELRFNEGELLQLFEMHGLTPIFQADVFWNATEGWGHRSYLTEKAQGLTHHSV